MKLRLATVALAVPFLACSGGSGDVDASVVDGSSVETGRDASAADASPAAPDAGLVRDASFIATGEMVATMTAKASGTGQTAVQAYLTLYPNPTSYLQLSVNDSLSASAGTESKFMVESSLLGVVTYTANLGSDAADTVLHVKLTRKVDPGAPDSSASLPGPFTLDALAKNTYTRAESILVSWTAAAGADPWSLDVVATCLDPLHQTADASATSTSIPAGALRKAAGAADECDATVTVTRSRSGSPDPAFHSGSTFVADQVRMASFHSTP